MTGEQDLMDALRATSIPIPALTVAQAVVWRRHWSASLGLPHHELGWLFGHGVRAGMVMVDPAPATPLYVVV